MLQNSPILKYNLMIFSLFAELVCLPLLPTLENLSLGWRFRAKNTVGKTPSFVLMVLLLPQTEIHTDAKRSTK